MISPMKILSLFIILSLSLSLASCLRDADAPPERPSQGGEYSAESENIIWQTDESTAETESAPIPPQIVEAAQMWIDKRDDVHNTIMTEEEILRENRRMTESESLVDVLLYGDAVTSEDVRGAIERYAAPALPAYDTDGEAIDASHLESVMDNRAVGTVAGDVSPRPGIITSRANLRSIPDHRPYRKAPDDPYDTVQQTELHVGTPVWVLHSSADGEYLFLRSYNYAGWVDAADVAVTDDGELWRFFAAPERFVRITDVSVELCGEEIDMGVALPLEKTEGGRHRVVVPRRTNDGKLVRQTVTLRGDACCVGNLPYTWANFLNQAFKYEGTMYSWGGLDTGVDCSGFIGNVMRTFGFMLPRDTRDQESVVGGSVDVRGKSHAEIAAMLESTGAPTAVYYPGHVLFYLGYGRDEGKHYFIHAPRIGEAVSVTEKTDLSGMSFVCELTSVGEA